MEEIFSKIVVLDDYSIRLHMQKAPETEAFCSSANKSSTSMLDGGPSNTLNEPFFLTSELTDIIKFSGPRAYQNESFLTNLYVKKRYSLRRISKELGCSKSTVRKKLFEVGVGDFSFRVEHDKRLKEKINRLQEQGLSYQKIADKFNILKIATRSKGGKWYGKTVREICTE